MRFHAGDISMFDHVRARFAQSAIRLRGFRLARRFLRQRKGAAAVEFALIAAPFLGLTFAIMETAIVFFAGQTLETAAATASRLILTGQAQTQGMSAATFKQQVCNQIYGLFDCANGVYVDVQKYVSFASINISNPIDANGNLNTGSFGFNPGGPGDIVVMRLYYKWPVYVNLLGLNLSNMSGGFNLLAATAVFRNEPYAS
jgi:Flp pilus assembly protein TadG